MIELMKKISSLIMHYWRKYVFSVQVFKVAKRDLKNPIQDFVPRAHVKFRTLDNAGLELLKKNEPANKIEAYRRRLRRGDSGYIALNGSGVPASVAWITYTRDKKDGVHIPLNRDEAILLESYTYPDYRRKGIQSFMIAERLKLLSRKGYSGAYVIYLKDNDFSRRALIKNCFSEINKVYYINFFNLKFQISKQI